MTTLDRRLKNLLVSLVAFCLAALAWGLLKMLGTPTYEEKNFIVMMELVITGLLFVGVIVMTFHKTDGNLAIVPWLLGAAATLTAAAAVGTWTSQFATEAIANNWLLTATVTDLIAVFVGWILFTFVYKPIAED